MDREKKARLKFWGVRGSIPTPESNKLHIGGNTPCTELRTADNDIMVFDAGTGIINLGNSIIRKGLTSQGIHLFLSHFHWDHIQGLPFFKPIYRSESRITIYSSQEPEQTRRMLEAQMSTPFFPVDFKNLPARITVRKLRSTLVRVGGARVLPFSLNHPQGATGFRIETNQSTIVFATDHEPGVEEIDQNLRSLSKDADILIADTHFSPEDYQSAKGWGHGTWKEAVDVCQSSEVDQLFLFHHNPAYSDDTVRSMLNDARKEFRSTKIAREGTAIEIG